MSRFVRAWLRYRGGKNGVEEGRFVFISDEFQPVRPWVSRVVKMKGSLGPRENST